MAETIILTPSQCKISNVVWDLDWLGEAEIQILIEAFPKGPFIYQAICCEIGLRGGFLPKHLLRGLCSKTKTTAEEIEAIAEECAVLGILSVTPHGITSRRVQREIEKFMKMKIQKKVKDAIIIFPWSELKEAIPPTETIAPPGEIKSPLGGETSPPSKERKGKIQERKDPDPGKEVPPPAPSGDPEITEAERHLEVPNGQPWTNQNPHIGTGRRPMRRFPSIHLTPGELATIMRNIEDAGLPTGERRKVFEFAESYLKTNRMPDRIPVDAWLSGFCLSAVLDVTKKSLQLKQTIARANG